MSSHRTLTVGVPGGGAGGRPSGVIRVVDTPHQGPTFTSCQADSELEEILRPPPLSGRPAEKDESPTVQASDSEFGSENNSDDEEDGRPVISPNKTARTIPATVNPWSTGSYSKQPFVSTVSPPSGRRVLPGGHTHSSHVTSANVSHISVRVSSPRSVSASLSVQPREGFPHFIPPGTPELTSDGSDLRDENVDASLLQMPDGKYPQLKKGPVDHAQGRGSARTSPSIGMVTPTDRPGAAHYIPKSNDLEPTNQARRVGSSLSVQSTIGKDTLVPIPSHRHQSSWMGDEIGSLAQTSDFSVPAATAAAVPLTAKNNNNTARIHVVRIKEKKDTTTTHFGVMNGNKKRGDAYGNYKMPHNPYYKNQNQINRDRALGRLPDPAAVPSPEEEDEEVKTLPLGESAWHANLTMPVYRADGELDPVYVAKKTRNRQRVALRTFLYFILLYTLTEVPYVLYAFSSVTRADLNPDGGPYVAQWHVRDNLVSLAIRVAMSMVLIGAAFYARMRHQRDVIGHLAFLASQPERHHSLVMTLSGLAPQYRFFRTDQYCGVWVCLAGVMLTVLERFRESDFLESNLLLRDGLMMELTLLLTYMIGTLRVSRLQAFIQGMVIFLSFNATYAINMRNTSEHLNYLLKCDAYLVLVLVSLCIYHLQLREFAQKDNEKKKALNMERRKADKLLRSMLPGPVYTTVLEGRNPYLSGIATIGFCNVELSYDETTKPSPAELMQRLHDAFKRIDGIVSVYKGRGVHKIETVSKTYLLCCGLLEEIEDHAASMVDVCLEIMHMIQGRNQKTANSKITSGLKIGIATGPVVGGIIGTQRKFFRVFGDTVNVSARMCTNCQTWQIQANKYAYDSLNELQRSQYKFPPMRILEIKGKGSMEVYLVERRADWVPRFSKAVLNRGKEEEVEEGSTKDLAASFVFHKILKATHLRRFPLLQYASEYVHHDAELLKNEGPSRTTTEHIEYRYQIAQFNMWMPRTKWNIAWFFLWCVAAFVTLSVQRIKRDGAAFNSIGLNFLVLSASLVVMLAVHFATSYALASNNLYKKYTQSYTCVYAFGISAWILVALAIWGLNAGPVAPHFVFLLLNIYTALYLHLQLRFTVPLMAINLVGFLVILLLRRYNVLDIIFCMSFLAAGTAFILIGTFRNENRIRSDYLIQYALDMEQGQMDNFLKNLLPQFVVNVLKKHSPTKRPDGAVTKRGSVADPTQLAAEGEYSARGTKDDGRYLEKALVAQASSRPGHHRRRSVFDHDGDNLMGGGGGLASRFSMNFPMATVFESDIVGYTKLVSNWPAQRTLNMLNQMFSIFDQSCEQSNVEKIETIGDAFMCITFEGEPDNVLNFALDVIAGLRAMNNERPGELPIEIRSGVCTGPCYGGVVGSDVPRFHVFGHAHDGSVLLEQNGRSGTAMVSALTFQQSCARYDFEHRPEIQCEGLGDVYQLMGRAASQSQREKNVFNEINDLATPASPSNRKGWV